tara:strand:- start:1109 stop:1435 length:327 start_codon:yes stop_codon:yes gene_type:complete
MGITLILYCYQAEENVASLEVLEFLHIDFFSIFHSSAQDYVEASLSELGYFHVAKAYILYRNEHTKKRLAAAAMIGGRVDGLKLTMNAVRLLEQRYLLRDENGIVSSF